MVSKATVTILAREHFAAVRACSAHVLLCLRAAVSSSPATSTMSLVLTFSTSLFRPYIKLDLRAANLYPRDNCTFCADKISGIANELRATYGLRRVYLPVIGFLLSSSTMHLLNLPSETSGRNLSQGMHDLSAMSMNHFFASKCVDKIRSLASKWQINLPDHIPIASHSRQRTHTPGSIKSASVSCQDCPQSDTHSVESQESQSSEPGDHGSPFVPPVPYSLPHDLSFGSSLNSYGGEWPPISQIYTQQQSFWVPFYVQTSDTHLKEMQSFNTRDVDASAEPIGDAPARQACEG